MVDLGVDDEGRDVSAQSCVVVEVLEVFDVVLTASRRLPFVARVIAART